MRAGHFFHAKYPSKEDLQSCHVLGGGLRGVYDVLGHVSVGARNSQAWGAMFFPGCRAYSIVVEADFACTCALNPKP